MVGDVPVRVFSRDPATGHVLGAPVGPQLALPITQEDVGEIRLYRFVLPFLPPSKNEYDNWPGPWKGSAKKKWINAVAHECEAMMVPKGNLKIGLSATLVFDSNRRRDRQNYANCLWNWVPDALVRCGVLVDDQDGAIDFGENLGVRFAVDLRPTVPKARRKRTQIALTMRVV